MFCKSCLRRGVVTPPMAGRLECEDCAEAIARKRKHTIVPLHKQGYMAFSAESAPSIVKQLNPKRGGL